MLLLPCSPNLLTKVETVQRHGIFTVDRQFELLQRHRLIAELHAELALVAVAFQVEATEGDLLVLTEFVRAGEHDIVAIGIQHEFFRSLDTSALMVAPLNFSEDLSFGSPAG